MRAELRRLHTEEGGILLQIKLHLARKGRAGGWAEFLRQRKPKPLSRTTADRWIHWYLDSDKQQQTHAERAPEQLSENAPQDESGAFSCTDAQSLQVPSDPEVPGSSDPPSASGSKAFEDLQQLVVLLRKSQAARFKASAEFLVGNGSENHHEAIYVAVVEAAATLGFVYPANAEGEADYGIEETDSRTETPAGGDKAA